MAAMLMNEPVFSSNPLDIAESIITSREWAFDRPIEDELVAEVSGKWCNFRIWFTWQPELEAVMFSCSYDLKVPSTHYTQIFPLVLMINERMWIGHFDICAEDGTVTFRHSLLLRGTKSVPQAQLEELLDIAIEECERFYPAFQSVLWAGQTPQDAIKFAMFDTFGMA